MGAAGHIMIELPTATLEGILILATKRASLWECKNPATPQHSKVIISVSILIGLMAGYLAFQSVDLTIFLSASHTLLTGQSPYSISEFVYPVSMALLIAPFSLLPPQLVFRAVMVASVNLYAFVILRATRSLPIAILAILSPLFLYNFFYASLDWLVFAALLVGPIPAFLLAMLKPQIGIGIAIIALLKVRRPVAVLLILAEATIFLASLALGMHLNVATEHPGNMCIFPNGLIAGIPLMFLAVQRRDPLMALAAAPLCSPYVGPQSWIAILPFLVHQAHTRYRLRTRRETPKIPSRVH